MLAAALLLQCQRQGVICWRGCRCLAAFIIVLGLLGTISFRLPVHSQGCYCRGSGGGSGSGTSHACCSLLREVASSSRQLQSCIELRQQHAAGAAVAHVGRNVFTVGGHTWAALLLPCWRCLVPGSLLLHPTQLGV